LAKSLEIQELRDLMNRIKKWIDTIIIYTLKHVPHCQVETPCFEVFHIFLPYLLLPCGPTLFLALLIDIIWDKGLQQALAAYCKRLLQLVLLL
jgi:hypothetical protein